MELWDLYTQDRERTGKTMVRGEAQPEGYYRLVVHVGIFNRKGEMLIQQRQSTKKNWADMWDVTVGGSAIAGETSRMAAEREVAEEIGIRLSLDRPALTIHFEEGFDDFYLAERELDADSLILQEEEVQAVKWASLEDIMKMMEEGTFIPWARPKMELLFYLHEHAELPEEN